MDDLKVENAPLNVIPVTEYDPFEAKFAASLYWLVFRATEDGEFESIPSQVTSPIQRDSEKRITVRPEVTEFLTSGEVYCKVCNSIFHSKVPVVGHWAILQMLSRHGFYVVEEGDIAVTDSALQQRKPFRKSTHLALMDCLMSAFSSQAVTVQQVVQSVSKFSSFSASKELPFDLEDALLLWMNKICAILNDDQLKKQKQHAEQLLQNQDKAKRFRFRRDQLQPKVQTEFPVMEDLLKDISDGQTLLGIIMFYHPTVINLEDIRFDKNLSTKDCVHNLDLFRSLCSQFICTSVLALKLEDILYGSQAMKPNVIALLAEIFHKCEVESRSTENGVTENQISVPEVANKENVMDNKSSSAPVLNTDSCKINEQEGLRELLKSKHERLGSSSKDRMEQVKSGIWKSQSDGQVNSNSASSFKSPFHLDFTVDDDMEQPPMNGPDMKRDVSENVKEKENPFSGIFQRPVLAGDRKRSLPNMPGLEGSPRTTPRQEHSLLARRNKQKQRTLDLEEWDVQQEEVEELNLNDLQRSQSLTGLDKAKVEPRQSFHAWREDTGASLSDTNLTSSRSERISINFRPNLSTGAPQRGPEELNMSIKSSGSKATAHAAPDSLNVKQHGDSILSGVRDSCMSDISTKELNQFEEIEAAILAGRSVETPRTFAKPKNRLLKAVVSEEDEDEFNTSVSSEDMNMFRLEVLQRLTEDKLRQIPDGAEMEDDDDPILLARNNAASGSGNLPDQRTRLEVQDTPTDVPIDQLSPITETAEPVVSNLNSVSSANSTAPSSPCSPLDVAPFMPAFFTTSPASTLDRKNQRLGMKGREDTEETLVGEEDDFPDDPETSATPRFKPRSRNESRDFLPQSKSFEHLARGSYTVGHVSVESAKAAGLPVIGGGCSVTEAECSAVVSADPVFEPGKRVFNEEFIGRPNASTSSSVQREPSEVFNNREFSQKQTDSRQDLSGIRPLVLSSGDVEPIGVTAEVLDGRRDSLESSPAHSPALALGKRDHAYEEVVMRSREMTAQESPSDVVIFERSLASFGAPDNNLHGPFNSQTRENAPCNSGDLPASNKAEAYVFDFNQVAIHHYKNGHTTQDFRTYKKSKQAGPPESKVSQANLRAASFHEETANQGLHRLQHEAPFGTYNKQAGTPESKVPQANLPAASFHEETANQGLHRSQHEAHFGTYNKQAGPPESKVPQANLRAASFHEETANQGLHRSQQEAYFGTYNKHSHFASQEQSRISHLRTSDTKEADSVDGRYRQRSSEDAPLGRVYAQGVRQSDGFSTFRKDTSSQQKIGATESDSGAHMLEMRRSDGFTTFRKGETTIVSVTSGRKPDDHIADQFAGEDLCHARAQDGLQHFYSASASEHVDLRQAPPVYDITPRPLPSSGGETEIQTSSRGRQEELVRTSVPSNITRSRTFRKTPDGQIIKDHNIYANSSSVSSASDNSKLAGQQTVITSIRGSPEGAGSDNPHRISWTDESEAGARLIRQHNTSGDRSESPTNRTGRRGSPRQSGRGSPGARISWLIAAKNGVGGQVMLNDKGEIEESQQDEAEEEQAVTSQLAYLRMQLDEKRRHIEAEKHRTQAEWEDQRRRLGQTAFWYVIGKAQGGQAGGERPGSEALHQDQAPAMQLHFQDKSGKSMAGFPDQPSPPIAWSSPANSPLPSSVPHPAPNNRQFETREFRLSEYPPDNDLSTNPDVKRPSSQPVVEVSSRPTPISPRPSSHDPAASHHTAPTRKCWEVDVGQKATPPPLIRPETASMNLDTMQESVPRESGGTPEIEVENHSPFKKGLALFIGDDDRAGNQGLTPEQVRKREKFLRLRQKKQEEDRTRKEAELEKKRRREEKQREKEMLRRMEEEKLRQEEQERKKAEQELRLKDAQAARVPDSYATYRRAGPWQHAYNVNEDASSYIASSPSQPSSFAEFSGPQCYVKPSGKSNRKIIVNAISHVCLSGTVNQDQKERCLQAISESDGHHFMILFKDGLKFRGIYIHNLENDQLFKVFGSGPRVVTSKMLEFLYKYNSGGKEFTKIPSKTISLSVDGFAIQKSCWNTGRPVVASRTSSNLKRPPRPPQR